MNNDNMEVEIYYGMSGAMKSATIDSKLSKYDLPVNEVENQVMEKNIRLLYLIA